MDDWSGFLGAGQLWWKAAHVIFVSFLMAGLFMMPRFFIYHAQVPVGSPEDAAWLARENRLRRIILNPAIIIVWVIGLMLMVNGGYWREGWFHAKLALVLGLSAYHGWIIGHYKKLARGLRPVSERKLRLLNEVPGVVTIAVVILAVVRPF